jgi:hypothetical protein
MQMLRTHQPLLLNWFRAKRRISSGVVEGLNNRLKLYKESGPIRFG